MTGMSKRAYSLAELANHVSGEVRGDSSIMITSVATLSSAGAHQISFLTNAKYKGQLSTTKAGAVIVNGKLAQDVQCAALLVSDPHVAFARIAQLFDTTPAVAQTGVADTAVVAPSASIGSDVALGHNVIIEDNVVIGDRVQIGANTVIRRGTRIGEGSTIHPNVTVYHDVVIGKRVVIHSQTAIGSDGFGYANDKGTWIPIPQTGSVVIGDDSQIGSNTSIDRGALEDTVIGQNVIIDNQVQIAHNIHIGDHSCICGSTGIAGSTHIGKHVVIAGGCAINGHISICDNVQITGNTMVIQDIEEPGVYSSGQPAMTNREWRKNTIRLRQIDELNKRVKALENR